MHTADGRYEVVVNHRGKWLCVASTNDEKEAMHIVQRIDYRTAAVLDMRELRVISHRGIV